MCADDFICAFDAWENYDVLCQFYDSCLECQSFPREEYFSEGSQDHWGLCHLAGWRDRCARGYLEGK